MRVRLSIGEAVGEIDRNPAAAVGRRLGRKVASDSSKAPPKSPSLHRGKECVSSPTPRRNTPAQPLPHSAAFHIFFLSRLTMLSHVLTLTL